MLALHLHCLVAIVVDAQDVALAVTSVYIVHYVVHAAAGGGTCGGDIIREEVGEGFFSEGVFYGVLAGFGGILGKEER